jgi:hypothetical protein
MDLGDRIGWCGLDWSGSGLGQMESSRDLAMDLRVPKILGNYEWFHNWWPLEYCSAP